jgi:hypothetical protein
MRLARGPRFLVAPLAGLAIVLLLGVLIGTGGGGHPARPAVAGAAAAPEAEVATRAARWLGGPAGKLLSAVTADLGRLAAAGRAREPGAARLAGKRLSAAAKAALLGPPPPQAARLYRSALEELETAGRCAASGRFRAAGTSLSAGESNITRATAAANSPAAAGFPGGAAGEPAGQ